MVAKVKVNKDILRQCREQVALSLEAAQEKTKIATLAAMESGDADPTFNQLDKLAEIYGIPRWVFIAESLPHEYQFNQVSPAFRQFTNVRSSVFSDYKVRLINAKVERLRNLVLELREDMDESVASFVPFATPKLVKDMALEEAAKKARAWLGLKRPADFLQLKTKLEEKNIFVFMTSKYSSWSHIDKKEGQLSDDDDETFRGLSIYYSKLPIIVVNDSDAQKAQSFTLFHELGHLLRGKGEIDDWKIDGKEERWCNEFAGSVLMPQASLRKEAYNVDSLDEVKRVANIFKVSPFACIVHLKQLKIINQSRYLDFEEQLKIQYEQIQKTLKESKGGPARQRPTEVLNQYGNIYTNTIFQAYYNEEIGLHKLCQLFDLKQPSHALDLEEML